MSRFEMGDRVIANGKRGTVTGIGHVAYNDDSDGDIYVVDFEQFDMGAFFEGDLEEDMPEEYAVEVAYLFSATLKAGSEFDAQQALREALVDVLTWDGDEDAPDALQELQMRSIPVPEKVPA